MKILQEFLNIFSQQYLFNQVIFSSSLRRCSFGDFLKVCVFSNQEQPVGSAGLISYPAELKTTFRNFCQARYSCFGQKIALRSLENQKGILVVCIKSLNHYRQNKTTKKNLTSSFILILTHSLYQISDILLEFFTLYFPLCLTSTSRLKL